MIKKYRKKPVIIEAIQWNGENIDECLDFMREGEDTAFEGVYYSDIKIDIKTLEGTMTADIGDFIIKGVNGEFYPCKPDIFEKTYELI